MDDDQNNNQNNQPQTPISDFVNPPVNVDSYTQPVVPEQPVVNQPFVQPIQQPEPIQVITQAPLPKKSHKGLIITGVVLLVIILGAVGGYFYLKISADKAASTYKTSLKTYLAAVSDSLETAKTDPEAAKSAIDKLEKPSLDSTILSDLSSDYVDAQTIASGAEKKLDAVNQEINDYTVAHDLFTTAEAVSNKALELPQPPETSVSTYLTTVMGYIDEIIAAIDKGASEVSDKNKAAFTELSDLFKEFKGLYSDFADAYAVYEKTGDQTGVLAVSEKMSTFASENENAGSDISALVDKYYENQGDSLDSSVDALETYAEKIE